MMEFEDLNDGDKEVYMHEVEKYIEPLVSKGIVKKLDYQGRKVYQTPVNPIKFLQFIHKARESQGEDPNTMLINGQIVMFSFSALFSMIITIHSDGEEQTRELEKCISEMK